MEPIRVIDMGMVSPLRSQSIFHGVAHAMTEDSPDTLVLVGPTDPYVCIGYHQELEKEVDLEYCEAEKLPVFRREVGGGAVYLDKGQVFTQWIFKQGRLPFSLEERFALYIQPLVETYQSLGIDATLRPVNDIHVQGKKIGGTGAAQIGVSDIVVGSLMFDFNFELMARVLKVPSEKMRDKIFQSLNEYMTTMTKQLGTTPDYEDVKREYMRHVSEAIGRPLEIGKPTDHELAVTKELEKRFVSPEWLYQKGGLRQVSSVKIHADVYVTEAMYKSAGGLIRSTVQMREGRIDDITLSGDFTVLPSLAVASLEQALKGVALEEAPVREAVTDFYRKIPVQSPGVDVEDWVKAVMAASGQAPLQ
jgi:lipoate-protein ligase A